MVNIFAHPATTESFYSPANFLELFSTTGLGLLASIFEIIVTINYGLLIYFLEPTSITVLDAMSEFCSLESSAIDFVSFCNNMKLKFYHFELCI